MNGQIFAVIRAVAVCVGLLCASSSFAYDAGFLENGDIYICNYSNVCSSSDNSNANPAPVGNGVGFIKITNPSNPNGVTINIGKACPPVPSGWTAASPCVNGPVPPATAGAPTVTYGVQSQVAATFPTFAAACAYWVSGISGGSAPVSTGGVCTYTHGGTPGIGGYAQTTDSTCSAGYTNSGGTCTISDANLVPYPATQDCTVVRSGNTFAFDSRNPGCDTGGGADSPAKASNLTASGGVATVSSAGKGITVTIASDGTTTVSISQPNVQGTNTITKTIQTAPAGAGATDNAVTGTGVGVTAGAGTLGTGTAIGGSGQDNCGAPGQPICAVKVDETGTPTAATANGTAAIAGMASDKAAADAAAASGDMAGLGYGKFTNPGAGSGNFDIGVNGSASCTAMSATLRGQTFAVDYCPVANYVKPILAWMFSMIVGLYAWRTYAQGPRNMGA